LDTHSVDRLSGTGAVRAAGGGHPYVEMYTSEQSAVWGYRTDGGLAWRGTGPWGPVIVTLGAPEAVTFLVRRLQADGALAGARTAHLPRALPDLLTGTGIEDWDFRWTTRPLPQQPGEARVVPLDGADEEIAALLAAAHPQTSIRPGHARVRRWYGIRVAGRLVACGADASRGVGVLSALTVSVGHRGRGLGGALTAATSRALHAEYGTVALSVAPGNPAGRLYERLGFTRTLAVRSVYLRA
jgi:ribosomal protein S18 acetylase RimI-like enzyme